MRRLLPIVAGLLAALALAGCSGFGPSHAKAPAKRPSAASRASSSSEPQPVSLAPVPSTYGSVSLPEGEAFGGGFFNASSPWNQTVEFQPVSSESSSLMHQASERVGVIDFSGDRAPVVQRRFINAGIYINTQAWTDPVVQGGPPTTVECRQTLCGDATGLKSLNIPTNVNPDPRYDGWFTVITPNGLTAWDLWRARRLANGSISFQYGRKWALNGSGHGSPGKTSARGSGLPLFAGLIRPQELEAGSIDHALAISVPAPASEFYVSPASSTDGNGATTSLPEGARIVLKPNVTLTPPVNPANGKPLPFTAQQQRYASAIASALRRYGAIVVGRAAVPTLYAQRDVTSQLLMGNELQSLTLSDFEALTLPPKHQDMSDG
jgi:hypothetical protein